MGIRDEWQEERVERLLGVSTLMECGEKEGEEYMAERPTDRACRYWNPHMRGGDEIMMSLLELLYSNKAQLNYFTVLGVIAVVKLMAKEVAIYKYIMSLPGPSPNCPSYLHWLN